MRTVGAIAVKAAVHGIDAGGFDCTWPRADCPVWSGLGWKADGQNVDIMEARSSAIERLACPCYVAFATLGS